MLALQAYKREHGGYPIALTKLIPSYLPEIPNDPFNYRTSLSYRREGSSCVLWSIGPDQMDQNGKPVYAKDSEPSTRISPASSGDIVAGINKS
jgi:hypothetical protein